MDHRDRIRQNHELLGFEDLLSMSLYQLVQKVDRDFPSGVSKGRRLDVFMAWLNERLGVIDASDVNQFHKEIREWCNVLTACNYENQDIIELFNDWRHAHSIVEPSSSRRLEFAGVEISRILMIFNPPEARWKAPNAPQSNMTVEGYGNIHPDRLNLSRTVINLDETVEGYGNIHPDRLNLSRSVIDLDKWEPSVINISSDEENEPSFLTGANVLPKSKFDLSERQRVILVDNLHWPDQLPIETQTSQKLAVVAKPPNNQGRGGKQKVVPSRYVCKRCEIPGHWIQNCPTNCDPAYDLRLPPPNYRCNICGKGNHFKSACPLQRDSLRKEHQDGSLIQAKRRAWAAGAPRSEASNVGRNNRFERDGHRTVALEYKIENWRGWDKPSPAHRPSRRRPASPISRVHRRESPRRGRDQRSRSPLRRDSRRNRSLESEVNEKGIGSTSPQKSHQRTLNLPVRNQEEGRLSYSDECDGDTLSRLSQPKTPAVFQGPTPGFISWLENKIDFIESGDEAVPIELGVTLKSLDRDPAYDPIIPKLIPQQKNVWVHSSSRILSWTLWADETAAEPPAAEDTVMTEAWKSQAVEGVAIAEECLGQAGPPGSDEKKTGEGMDVGIPMDIDVKETVSETDLPRSPSVPAVSKGHETDVAMTGMTSLEVLAESGVPVEESVLELSPDITGCCVNDQGTNMTDEPSHSVDEAQPNTGIVTAQCTEPGGLTDTASDVDVLKELDTGPTAEVSSSSASRLPAMVSSSSKSTSEAVVCENEDCAARDMTSVREIWPPNILAPGGATSMPDVSVSGEVALAKVIDSTTGVGLEPIQSKDGENPPPKLSPSHPRTESMEDDSLEDQVADKADDETATASLTRSFQSLSAA